MELFSPSKRREGASLRKMISEGERFSSSQFAMNGNILSVPAVSACTTSASSKRSTTSPGISSASDQTSRRDAGAGTRFATARASVPARKFSFHSRFSEENFRQTICDLPFQIPLPSERPRASSNSAASPSAMRGGVSISPAKTHGCPKITRGGRAVCLRRICFIGKTKRKNYSGNFFLSFSECARRRAHNSTARAR